MSYFMDAYARSSRIPAVFQIKTPSAKHAQTKCPSAKAVGFACMMADFQNGLISRILGVFSSGFLHRTTLNHF